MIGRALPVWAVAAVIGTLVGALGGTAVTLGVKDGQLATLRQQHADQRARADRAALEKLAAANARADQLTYDLDARVSANAALQDQLDEQIERVTHGRTCLDAAALRLLDRAAQPPAVPAPPRRATAAGAAQPAANPAQQGEPAATDTDVARWANDAYRRYADCAARLDALIGWHEE